MSRAASFIFLAFLILSLPAHAYSPNGPRLQTTRSDLGGVSFEVTFEDLAVVDLMVDGLVFHRIEIPGGGSVGTDGEPEIPVLGQMIAIPDGMGIRIHTEVIEEEERGGILLAPFHEVIEREFARDAAAYARDEFLPEESARISPPATIAGIRIASILLQPVSYNPAQQRLRIARKMILTVDFVPQAGEKPGAQLSRPIARSFASMLRPLIPNLDTVLGNRAVSAGTWVLIEPDDAAVESRLQPLVDWRIRMGLPVRVATTAETGTTSASIKAWLQNGYDTWPSPPEYVVLAGDATAPYQIPTWFENLSGYDGEGDFPYVQLDGPDALPDAHIGRLSFSTLTELEAIVSKITGYEASPYITDPDWFRRACLIADPGASSFASAHILQHWVRARLLDLGYAEVDTAFGMPLIPLMQEQMNRGDTIICYRGTYQMSGWSNSLTYGLTNGWRLPFLVAVTCETGSFHAEGASLIEGFLRANAGVNNPRGAIGAIGSATPGTHTRYNNCLTYGIYQGLLYEGDRTLGAAFARGKLEMYRNYQATEPDQVMIWAHWNNLMGDPAVECWTGYPEPLSVEYPSSLPVGGNAVAVHITRAGVPEAAARVCLWDGTTQVIGLADDNGRVELSYHPVAAGSATLTVTAHDRHPFQATIPIVDEESFIALESSTVDDDAIDESQGNGDQTANPGETIELSVRLRNYGTAPETGVTATLTSEDPYVTISDAEESFGDIEPGGAAVSGDDFGFVVASGCPDARVVRFGLEIDAGQRSWHSLIDLPFAAPAFAASGTSIQDQGGNGILDPAESGSLVVQIRNQGTMDAAGITGTLFSKSPWVSVSDSTGGFGAIPSGQTGGNPADPFALAASPDAYPGHQAHLELVMNSNGGMLDTTDVVVQVGVPATHDPTGPDRYGYYALDDTDLGYSDAPVYSWVELDPAYGGTGTAIFYHDTHEGLDESHVIDLPFTFQFYGDVFNRVTICSNGWIALGETDLADYRNWTIPGAGAPPNLIAAFWDDLLFAGGSKILQKYDAIGHRWIVEWSQMRNAWGNELEVFEVILYDPAHYPTYTGDGLIDLQYQTVFNTDETDGYATVGIQNAYHTDGVLYTAFNINSPGAAPLVNGRAIRFAPVTADLRGRISGIVTNAEDGGTPEADVEIRVEGRDGFTRTDATGAYDLYLPPGTHTLEAGNTQFQTESVGGVVVDPALPMVVDFQLTDVRGPAIEQTTDIVHTYSLGPYAISAVVSDPSDVAAVSLHYRESHGTWHELSMTPVGDAYQAAISSGAPGEEYQYYVSAQDGLGHVSFSPSGAPDSTYSFLVTSLMVSYACEVPALPDWTMGVPGDDEDMGRWVREDPQAVLSLGIMIKPGDDHTPPPGVKCFVTGHNNAPVFGGCTTLLSPNFDLTGAGAAFFGYWRWYGEAQFAPEEEFVVDASSDGGVTWAPVERVPNYQDFWRGCSFRLDQFLTLTSQMRIRFVACDLGEFGYTAAAIDDFWIEVVPTHPMGVANGPQAMKTSLLPIRPNPSRIGPMVIRFALAEPGPASLGIYDAGGRLVRRLLSETRSAGAHAVSWDGTDAAGSPVGSGVYLCRFEANGTRRTSKIICVK